MAKLVHVAEADYDVYIGDKAPGFSRSVWYNPFLVAPLGPYTPRESATLYEERVRTSPALWAALKGLEGKTLGCWCRSWRTPEAWCHGEVLLRLLAERGAESA
jgi:hypothetical protein